MQHEQKFLSKYSSIVKNDRSRENEKNEQISPNIHESNSACIIPKRGRGGKKAKLNVILKIVLPCNTQTKIFETIVPSSRGAIEAER